MFQKDDAMWRQRVTKDLEGEGKEENELTCFVLFTDTF